VSPLLQTNKDFGKSHFGIMGKFWHVHRLVLWMFLQISKWECFDMGTFWHEEFLSILLCKVPKIPKAKISCAEKSPCQNVPVLKCPPAGTSAGPNGACAKMFP